MMLGLLLQQGPGQLVVKFGLFVLAEKEKQKAEVCEYACSLLSLAKLCLLSFGLRSIHSYWISLNRTIPLVSPRYPHE